MNFLAWIVVGLIAGWLAGQVMKGGGYGVLVDIILGILGGFLGGWIFGLLGIGAGSGMIGSMIVAFVGAVILVGITRLIKTGLSLLGRTSASRRILPIAIATLKPSPRPSISRSSTRRRFPSRFVCGSSRVRRRPDLARCSCCGAAYSARCSESST